MYHIAFDFFSNIDINKIKNKFDFLIKFTNYNFRNVTKDEVSKNFSLLYAIINSNIVSIVDRYKKGNFKDDEIFFSSPSWVYYAIIGEYSFGIDFNEYYYEILYKQHYLNKKDKNNFLLPKHFYIKKKENNPMWNFYIIRVDQVCKRENLNYTIVNTINDLNILKE